MKGVEAIVSILVAVVGLATLAIILSKKADTANVLTAGFGGFGNLIRAAVAPVS